MKVLDFYKIVFLFLIISAIGIQCVAVKDQKIYPPNEAKTDKKALPFADYNYIIPIGEGKFIINSKGNVSFLSQNNNKQTFNLYEYDKDGWYILKLYYIIYEDDLILLYSLDNGEYGGGQITRIKHENNRIMWNVSLPSAIDQSLIEGNSLYMAGINGYFAEKLDLNTGKPIWQYDGLDDKYQLGELQKLGIKDEVMELVFSDKVDQQKRIVLQLSKKNGKEHSVKRQN